ncbi:MAG: hypothetical protein Q9202_003852 [Teloschistes flavicans]
MSHLLPVRKEILEPAAETMHFTHLLAPMLFLPNNNHGVGKKVLVFCENVIGIVLSENTGTGTNCAFSSGEAGTMGKYEDSTRPKPVYCAAVVRIVASLWSLVGGVA